MYYNVENFINYCDDYQIAEEGKMSSSQYKSMRKMQTNSVALRSQLSQQKKLCEKKYQAAKNDGSKSQFIAFLEKNKAATQRKINGTEISNKDALQKFITLYDDYLRKAQSLPE